MEGRPFGLVGLAVKATVDRAARRGAGERIGRERGGAATEHVTQKLVERDDMSERRGSIVLQRSSAPATAAE
jgi:hypothetical protein